VGYQNGHLVRRARAIRRDVVPHSCSDVPSASALLLFEPALCNSLVEKQKPATKGLS